MDGDQIIARFVDVRTHDSLIIKAQKPALDLQVQVMTESI